jgi:carboxymethylenebutenolidase
MTEQLKTSNIAICEEEISISRPSGTLPVFCAYPDDKQSHPAVILIHEIFGVNEHIKDLARRFARQSYAVYAPDLFAYAPGLPENRNDIAAMRSVWAGIADDQLISDLQAVFSEVRSSTRVQGKPIGAIGYCMGGAIAFMFACRSPMLAWVADYYGRIYYQDLTDKKPRHPISYTGGLNCPLLGLFAGVDDLITEEHVQHFEKKLQELGKTYQMKVYPGAKHAFFNDTREFYHYDAANDAWQLTLSFIASHSVLK